MEIGLQSLVTTSCALAITGFSVFKEPRPVKGLQTCSNERIFEYWILLVDYYIFWKCSRDQHRSAAPCRRKGIDNFFDGFIAHNTSVMEDLHQQMRGGDQQSSATLIVETDVHTQTYMYNLFYMHIEIDKYK